jgi:hypothetical protein
LSSQSKIVVELISPDFGSKPEIIKLEKVQIKNVTYDLIEKNELNNISWTLKVKAGKEVEIPFTYFVSWPSSQMINNDY